MTSGEGRLHEKIQIGAGFTDTDHPTAFPAKKIIGWSCAAAAAIMVFAGLYFFKTEVTLRFLRMPLPKKITDKKSPKTKEVYTLHAWEVSSNRIDSIQSDFELFRIASLCWNHFSNESFRKR